MPCRGIGAIWLFGIALQGGCAFTCGGRERGSGNGSGDSARSDNDGARGDEGCDSHGAIGSGRGVDPWRDLDLWRDRMLTSGAGLSPTKWKL